MNDRHAGDHEAFVAQVSGNEVAVALRLQEDNTLPHVQHPATAAENTIYRGPKSPRQNYKNFTNFNVNRKQS